MEKSITCVHSLTTSQIKQLLQDANVRTGNCVLLHPTADTLVSFDMIKGNKKYMFSDGQSYFEDVLKSLSLKKVIEKTIIRSFLDTYTPKEAVSDWKKMEKDMSSLLSQEKDTLYKFFLCDINRFMRRAVQETMHSIDKICKIAQRTLKDALFYHAVLNLVPCKAVEERKKVGKGRHLIVARSYAYEKHIAEVCKKTEDRICMTQTVPPQEDCVIIYDYEVKGVKAFLYDKEKLVPLNVVFFCGVSHESFTRRATHPYIQTHSLCETVLPLEMYLHSMISTRMKVLKDLGFRNTVIIQNLDDSGNSYDDSLTKNSKGDKSGNQYNFSEKSIEDAVKAYRREINETWSSMVKAMKDANKAPYMDGEIDISSEHNTMSGDIVNNTLSLEGNDIGVLVRKMMKANVPLHGNDRDRNLAYIQSAADKSRQDYLRLLHNNHSMRNALAASEQAIRIWRSRNVELYEKLTTLGNSHSMQTRAMSKLQQKLEETSNDLKHMRSLQSVPNEESSDAGQSVCMQENIIVDINNNDDYNAHVPHANDKRCVRYVNISDSSEKKLRYLNANFSVPPMDGDIVSTARQAWERLVRCMFFLRDDVYTSTGNKMERQLSYETTCVYVEGFCREFMNFKAVGRVVFDHELMSKTDTVDYMFKSEVEGTAIEFVNKIF